MSEATLKATLGDETRRVRLATPTSFAAFEQYLLKLFPNLGTVLAQAHDVRLQICVRSDASNSSPTDQVVDSIDTLRALWTGASDCRIMLNLRLVSRHSAPVAAEVGTAATEPLKRNKMRSHYLKHGERGPVEVQERASNLPPVFTTAAAAAAAAAEEWELLDQDEAASSIVLPMAGSRLAARLAHSSTALSAPPSFSPVPMSSTFAFYLNHKLHTPDMVALPLDMSLAQYIREVAQLSGTKIGCGEGGCGACTVLLSYTNAADGTTVSVPVNACLRPLLACDGMSVTTIEGVGSATAGYHPVQTRLAQNAGSQCGYCSPGFGVNAFALLVTAPQPTPEQVENRFQGNLCRCTGYRPILEAYRSFCTTSTHGAKLGGSVHASGTAAASTDAAACCGQSCATCTEPCATQRDIEDLPYALRRAGHKSWAAHPATALSSSSSAAPTASLPACASNAFERQWLDRIVAELAELAAASRAPRALVRGAQAWFQPASLADTYALLQTYAALPVRLTVGNTAQGVSKYYPHVPADSPAVYIDIARIAELNAITFDSFGVHAGAAVTLDALSAALTAATNNPQLPGFMTAPFVPLIRHLSQIANVQVRSAASWAGNFMTAKTHVDFPSDFVCMFSAYRGMIEWTSASRGKRVYDVLTSLQYAQAADEFMLRIHIPYGVQNQLFDSYKIASRHQNAHAIVNASFNLFLDNKNVVLDGTIVVGGIKRGPLSCTQTVAALKGQQLSSALLKTALPVLLSECTPGPDPPQTTFVIESAAYRQTLSATLFYRYVLANWFSPSSLPPRLQSGAAAFARPISSGVQVFTSDASEAPVSYPIPKLSGLLQAAGEARYSNDMPLLADTLFAAYVTSTCASAKLVSIDASAALEVAGVAAFLSAQSIAQAGGVNSCGMFPGDEEVFASVEVGYIGQPIGMIVAASQELAERAAALVTAQYDTSGRAPPVFTIDEAIAASSFLPDNQYMQHVPSIVRGDVDKGFAESAVVLEGKMLLGAQAHFYMETQTAVAQWEENQVLRIFSSTQGAADVRATVATVIGVPSSKIIVEAPRMGGAFGGKLTRGRPLAAAVALAAKVLQRPVRAQMSRNDDMTIVGKRNPYQCEYKVGFNKDGLLIALQMKVFNNGGFNYDLSLPLMDNFQQWADNAYYVANWKTEGFCCKTNLPPFTAMRTPGQLEAIHMFEKIIERVAYTLGVDARVVREKNFYRDGQLTPYLQPLQDVTLPQVWATVIKQADYENRAAAVRVFNASNRWMKRGISLVPVKFGFALEAIQMTCVVHVLHEDGSVVITHSGAEIGQGLTTKVIQSVSYALGIDMAIITCRPTSTDRIPNFSMTGSSTTSEAVCQAALNACQSLQTTLAKYRTAGVKWPDAVAAAFAANENLNATGWYAPANPQYLFNYFVYAAACTEVNVDVLTGEVHVLRTDIAYDSGVSLNPIVDIGQIEGAFTQGIGFFMTEKCVYEAGKMVNNGTWDYKPPSSQDVPIDFRVTLLSNTPNARGILRSKGSGEPPYCLAASVLFATEMAVAAARADAGLSDFVALDVPATVPIIQQACGVDIAQLTV